MAGGARPRALDRLVVEIAEEQLEVLSGAPGVARAGQHQHLRLRIVLERIENVAHLVVQLRAHRIALGRPVKGYPRDAVLMLDFHGLICARHELSARSLHCSRRWTSADVVEKA